MSVADIKPEDFSHTAYLRGHSWENLQQQLVVFIKEMERNPDMEYDIICTDLCLAIDFKQRPTVHAD